MVAKQNLTDIEKLVKLHFKKKSIINELSESKDPSLELVKIIQNLTYSYCKNHGIRIDQVTPASIEIERKIADAVEKHVSSFHMDKKFNYKDALAQDKIEKLSKEIEALHTHEIPMQEYILSKDIAKEFISSYKNAMQESDKLRQFYQDKLKNLNPGDEFDKYQKLLNSTDGMDKYIKDTIAAMEAPDNKDIMVVFPIEIERNKYKDFTKRQIAAIINAKPGENVKASTSTLQELQETQALFTKISNSSARVEQDLYQNINSLRWDAIKPDYIKTFCLAQNFGQAIELSSKLVNGFSQKVDLNNLKLPIDHNIKKNINKLLEIHDIIQHNKDRNPRLMEFSKHLEQKVPLAKLQEINEKNLEHENKILLFTNDVKKSDASPNLSEAEIKFISLFNDIRDYKDIAENDKKFFATMLEESIGNKSFNTRLGLYENEKKNFSVAQNKNAIENIRLLTYKTRYADKIEEINEKVEQNLTLIADKQHVPEKNKLSQLELGILLDISARKEFFDKIDSAIKIPKNSKLANFYEHVKTSDAQINNLYSDTIAQSRFHSGDILMEDVNRSYASKGKKLSNETKLMKAFVSKYGHAASMYVDPVTKEPMLSHIMGNYSNRKANLQDLAISDVYRVDPTKAISPENAQKLKDIYGKDWKSVVKAEYEFINQQIHTKSKERFTKIVNDKDARFCAGLADYKIKGHKTKKNQNLEEIHNSMMGINDIPVKKKQICSEFSAKSVSASFYELNQRLKEKHPELKGEIIKQPFSKNEKLEAIHPERLVKLLKKADLITQVNTGTPINEMVSRKNLRGLGKTKPGISNLMVNKLERKTRRKGVVTNEMLRIRAAKNIHSLEKEALEYGDYGIKRNPKKYKELKHAITDLKDFYKKNHLAPARVNVSTKEKIKYKINKLNVKASKFGNMIKEDLVEVFKKNKIKEGKISRKAKEVVLKKKSYQVNM